MKAAPKSPKEYKKFILAKATYYTSTIFRGVGVFDTEKHPSLELARERAMRLGPGAMIYAIAMQGRTPHDYAIEYVDKDGSLKPTS